MATHLNNQIACTHLPLIFIWPYCQPIGFMHPISFLPHWLEILLYYPYPFVNSFPLNPTLFVPNGISCNFPTFISIRLPPWTMTLHATIL
ncbi:Uncharacterized protein TCM_038680 [Theobroma cacao]|uniref:Uncharacterized protein n=1 Tax=Theobroma cacao TaxID=3641 RepID=A0A061GRB9_THECC|nr:Uncharacterized protein TCM_038680 [Theobroma cacao]